MIAVPFIAFTISISFPTRSQTARQLRYLPLLIKMYCNDNDDYNDNNTNYNYYYGGDNYNVVDDDNNKKKKKKKKEL